MIESATSPAAIAMKIYDLNDIEQVCAVKNIGGSLASIRLCPYSCAPNASNSFGAIWTDNNGRLVCILEYWLVLLVMLEVVKIRDKPLLDDDADQATSPFSKHH